MSSPNERRMLGVCQTPWHRLWEISLALRGNTNGARPMWTLVNASYGIAMGQRPAGVAQSLSPRVSSQASSALLSSDPRLEETQWQPRDHLVQATHDQWAEKMPLRTRPGLLVSSVLQWNHGLWARLQRFASAAVAQVFNGLMRQTPR